MATARRGHDTIRYPAMGVATNPLNDPERPYTVAVHYSSWPGPCWNWGQRETSLEAAVNEAAGYQGESVDLIVVLVPAAELVRCRSELARLVAGLGKPWSHREVIEAETPQPVVRFYATAGNGPDQPRSHVLRWTLEPTTDVAHMWEAKRDDVRFSLVPETNAYPWTWTLKINGKAAALPPGELTEMAALADDLYYERPRRLAADDDISGDLEVLARVRRTLTASLISRPSHGSYTIERVLHAISEAEHDRTRAAD